MLIYVAGPFDMSNLWVIAESIRTVELAGLEIARRGHMPVIPHALSAKFDGECDRRMWNINLHHLLESCEALLLLPNWQQNPFCIGEKQWAEEECHIPVYTSIESIPVIKFPD